MRAALVLILKQIYLLKSHSLLFLPLVILALIAAAFFHRLLLLTLIAHVVWLVCPLEQLSWLLLLLLLLHLASRTLLVLPSVHVVVLWEHRLARDIHKSPISTIILKGLERLLLLLQLLAVNLSLGLYDHMLLLSEAFFGGIMSIICLFHRGCAAKAWRWVRLGVRPSKFSIQHQLCFY